VQCGVSQGKNSSHDLPQLEEEADRNRKNLTSRLYAQQGGRTSHPTTTCLGEGGHPTMTVQKNSKGQRTTQETKKTVRSAREKKPGFPTKVVRSPWKKRGAVQSSPKGKKQRVEENKPRDRGILEQRARPSSGFPLESRVVRGKVVHPQKRMGIIPIKNKIGGTKGRLKP